MAEEEFGHIDGYPPGSTFVSREEMSRARVHRPTQAGIAGGLEIGADSIVLSGGYEDDIDNSSEIIYTGHGGRDANSGKQVADQTLERGNLALVKSMQEGHPVRVVRGHTNPGPYSPMAGYRYDGLYRVEEWWRERGSSGFTVIRFRLVALDDTPLPIIAREEHALPSIPPRTKTTITRIVRDTSTSKSVKERYGHTCQVCGTRLEGPAGPYSEAAHIKPLGQPHNGPDTQDNILCLCPNHHTLFDLGAFTIAEDFTLIGTQGHLHVDESHRIDHQMLAYRRDHFGGHPGA